MDAHILLHFLRRYCTPGPFVCCVLALHTLTEHLFKHRTPGVNINRVQPSKRSPLKDICLMGLFHNAKNLIGKTQDTEGMEE
jgi:hypothetical protein